MHLEGSNTAPIHEPERIKITNEFKVTNQVYMQLTEPVIFEGLKHALKDLSGDANVFSPGPRNLPLRKSSQSDELPIVCLSSCARRSAQSSSR